MKPILLDTGPIVALLDPTDGFHSVCSQAIGNLAAPLVTCEAVIAESCYLLRNLRGGPEAVLENVAAGVFQIPLALPQAARGVKRVLQRYGDGEIDLADACLVHLANELGTGEIFTLDRDFHIYRWGKNNAFQLIISLS